MKPKLYNPCADGFAAKLWECLRRNEQFKDECKSWSIIKSKASWAATIARLESSISPAPLFAIVRHLFFGPDIWVPIEDHFKSLSLTLKKTWPELFQKIVDGDKNFDLRLADFKCKEGDVLVLEEWDPKSKKYTGRVLEKKVTFVLKTKDIKFWPEEEVEKYGYQIISFR